MIEICKLFNKELQDNTTNNDMKGLFHCFFKLLFILTFFIIVFGLTIILDSN